MSLNTTVDDVDVDVGQVDAFSAHDDVPRLNTLVIWATFCKPRKLVQCKITGFGYLLK